jgi:hypothetical protein
MTVHESKLLFDLHDSIVSRYLHIQSYTNTFSPLLSKHQLLYEVFGLINHFI